MIPVPVPAFIASKLKADPVLVDKVWKEAVRQKVDPLLVLALVQHESAGTWNPEIRGKKDPNDYGLFQLNSKYFEQYVGDVDKHIAKGVSVLKERLDRYGLIGGLSTYNSGGPNKPRGQIYARKGVLPQYERMKQLMADFWKGTRVEPFKFKFGQLNE